MMIFDLKLSRSDISDPDRIYPTKDSFDSKNRRFCEFFFNLFPLSLTSLSCISGPCLTLPPIVWSRSALKSLKDVGRSSSQAKKPRVHKVMLQLPPPIPSDEEDEVLPLEVRSPVEDLDNQRTQVNYMREDSQTIISQCNIPCYESAKHGPDPHFWSYFHADWYRPVYESTRRIVWSSRMSLRCVSTMGSRRSWPSGMIGMKK
jgi:hypothetical protein